MPHYRNSSKIQYQNEIKKQNWYPLTPKYMSDNFPGLAQSRDIESGGIKLVL